MDHCCYPSIITIIKNLKHNLYELYVHKPKTMSWHFLRLGIPINRTSYFRDTGPQLYVI